MAVVVMGLGDDFENGDLGGGSLGMAFHQVLWSVTIILLQGTKKQSLYNSYAQLQASPPLLTRDSHTEHLMVFFLTPL